MAPLCAHACCLGVIVGVLIINIAVVNMPCLVSFSMTINMTKFQSFFQKESFLDTDSTHEVPTTVISFGVWHLTTDVKAGKDWTSNTLNYAEFGHRVATLYEKLDSRLKLQNVTVPIDLKTAGQALEDIMSKAMIVLQAETTLAVVFASLSAILAVYNMFKCHGGSKQTHFVLAVSQLLTGVLLFFSLFYVLHVISQLKDLKLVYAMIGLQLEDVSCYSLISVGFIAVLASITMFVVQSWMLMTVKPAQTESNQPGFDKSGFTLV